MRLNIFTLLLLISNVGLATTEPTKLEIQLATFREAYLIPGMAAAIYKDGKLVEHAVSGIRKVGYPELISRTDKFHLGSCTKSMTATVAATFVEEGKLSWKSTLSELLPNKEIHPSLKGVTYEMLLAHRSGIITDPDDETYGELEKLETLEGREKLTTIYLSKAPEFTPGSYNYSNNGYIIAGRILELISGKSWETLMQERLFRPLQMESCGFGPTASSAESTPSQPWGHYVGDWSIKSTQHDNAALYGPSANVHCSISDWVKYLNVHLRGFRNESNFLTKESFQQLHRVWPGGEIGNYTSGGWLKVNREWANGEVLTHSGSNTYNYASVWMAPKTNTILISTTNRSRYSGRWATDDAITFMIKHFITNKP